MNTIRRARLAVWLLVAGIAVPAAAQPPSPVAVFDAGRATTLVKNAVFTLENRAIAASWEMRGGVLRATVLQDRVNNARIPAPDQLFSIVLADGRTPAASDFAVLERPRIAELKAVPTASRLSERLPGKQFVARLEHKQTGLRVTWRGVLRDSSTYLRQEVTLEAGGQDVPVKEIVLLDAAVPGAKVVGAVDGSPVVAGETFFGFEHPMSQSRVERGRLRCSLVHDMPIRAGRSFSCSSVIGVVPRGQLRRGFLAYLERERAHPYRTFLHYNTWYDIGYFTPFGQTAARDVVEAYGRELVRRRNVTMDSFLFDDGWDNPRTLWSLHAGFPNGFTLLEEEAAKYGAAPGVWLSPWGGYGTRREERLTYGREQGFETNKDGFALSGPVYYKRFRQVCVDFIRKYGVNQFKFDGIGRARGSAPPGSEFGSDFEAAIQLIHDLRVEKPDLYVNLTTGTWPSPFWLQYADSIWRGGEDHAFAGVGSDRQKWITYRDADTYEHIVRGGPLYPLSSLMLHGLIYARHAKGLDTDPHGDFTAEIRSYFGTGAQLQEMYVTPALLTGKNWDTLAEAARWSRANADVLKDTHWIGGDPAKLEVYGWASWSPAKAILVLRNPSDRPARLSVDVRSAFELPAGAPTGYRAHSPWHEDRGLRSIDLRAGSPRTFELNPFEVLTLDVVPAGT